MAVTVNQKYKDNLFCYLFGHEEMKHNLMELVSAITGRIFDKDADIVITTLKDFIYINVKNDVSCIINSCMYLLEQQSSINPNMPLRQLIYATHEYEGILGQRGYYGSKMITIPTPMCFVFCNDPRFQEEKVIYRLSDAFANKEVHSGCEWTVTCYNINAGKNKQLMDACLALKEYSLFVDKVRKFQRCGNSLKESIDLAVTECIKEDILKEFLLTHRAEVAEVVYTEFDAVEYGKQQYSDGREEGRLEEKHNIFNLLIKRGMSEVEAMEVTGLTKEDL